MTITFITGANKGLGYETARRLVALGHTVLVGARDPELGRAAADELGARFVPIDVTDDASVAAAADDVAAHEGRVDVLVNNAGIVAARRAADDPGLQQSPEVLDGPSALRVFDTNVVGIVRVTDAFLPLLRRSEHPAVVNVGSGMGSFAHTFDPDRVESRIVTPLYKASKAAVSMLTAQLARALPDIRVNVADPGHTATDLNHHRGTQTVAEGTDAIVALATEDPTAGTGRFVDRFGPVPW